LTIFTASSSGELLAVDAFARLEVVSVARRYPHLMPIERAEPSIMRMAASIVLQLRSFIFCSAISLTCHGHPALSRPGALAPDDLRGLLEERTPAASSSRT
jgi:hypothetical protein